VGKKKQRTTNEETLGRQDRSGSMSGLTPWKFDDDDENLAIKFNVAFALCAYGHTIESYLSQRICRMLLALVNMLLVCYTEWRRSHTLNEAVYKFIVSLSLKWDCIWICCFVMVCISYTYVHIKSCPTTRHEGAWGRGGVAPHSWSRH
jgi:hypothetical protein